MKHTLLILGALLIGGLCPFIGYAETGSSTTATTTPTTPEPATIEQSPAIAKGTYILTVAAQTRLTNLAANVSNRMEAYIRRITNVTDRLESRANKMKESGLDVEVARSKITEARTELEKARTSLMNIDTAVNSFVRSENPRTYWQSVKTTYTTARDAIKAAHHATVEALLLLKTAVAPTPTTATSTPDTTNIE